MIDSNGSEKRRIQRVRLDCPITAKIGSSAVILLDVSASGARIEHSAPLARGREVQLDFEYQDQSISVLCFVVRCKLQKSISGTGAAYSSGLTFCDPKSKAVGALRTLIAEFVSRDLQARKAHSRPA